MVKQISTLLLIALSSPLIAVPIGKGICKISSVGISSNDCLGAVVSVSIIYSLLLCFWLIQQDWFK